MQLKKISASKMEPLDSKNSFEWESLQSKIFGSWVDFGLPRIKLFLRPFYSLVDEMFCPPEAEGTSGDLDSLAFDVEEVDAVYTGHETNSVDVFVQLVHEDVVLLSAGCDELKNNKILEISLENCVTKIYIT